MILGKKKEAGIKEFAKYNMFRDSTQDVDLIIKTVSGITVIIKKIADENGLPSGNA